MADEESQDAVADAESPQAGADDVWSVNKPLPLILTDRELMSILRVKHSGFYRMVKDGELARFAIPNPVGRARWSGEKVQAWIRGEHVFVTRAFGAGRRRRRFE